MYYTVSYLTIYQGNLEFKTNIKVSFKTAMLFVKFQLSLTLSIL